MKIQLTLDNYGETLVKRLQHWTGAKPYTDLFNNAITLLDWAISQRAQGRIIASLDETNETYKELLMPCLQYAAALSGKEKYPGLSHADRTAARSMGATAVVAREK